MSNIFNETWRRKRIGDIREKETEKETEKDMGIGSLHVQSLNDSIQSITFLQKIKNRAIT